MDELTRAIRSHLVLTLGFSRRNAGIAVEMFRRGELTRPEEEVIYRIAINPGNDEVSLTYYKLSDPRRWVADHLNYRITLAGGDSVSKSSIRDASSRNYLAPNLRHRIHDLHALHKRKTARY